MELGGEGRMEFFKRWRREIMLNGNKRAVNLLRKRLAAIRDGQTARAKYGKAARAK